MQDNQRFDKRLAQLEQLHWKSPKHEVNRVKQVAVGAGLIFFSALQLVGVVWLWTHGRFGVLMSFLGVLATIGIVWSAKAGVELILGPQRPNSRRNQRALAEAREIVDTDEWLIVMNGGQPPRADRNR
ncbi:hypothetical protein GCM10010435_44060 [Winogradskya consettensis]|nr:hypothetical protein [Actinoplanes consettensis]